MTSFKMTVLPMIAGLVLAGCSSFPALSHTENDVSFDIMRGGDARITHVEAMNRNAETVIRGEAAFPNSVHDGFFTGSIHGRIDIPGSRPLVVRDITVHTERRPKTVGKHGYFTIHARKILPPGSVAHLTYSDR